MEKIDGTNSQANIGRETRGANAAKAEAPSAKTLGAVLRRYYLEIRPGRISNCSNDRDTYPCHLACRLPGTDLKLARDRCRGAVAGQTKVTRPRVLGGAGAKSVRCTIAFVAPKLYQLQTLAASPSPMLTKH